MAELNGCAGAEFLAAIIPEAIYNCLVIIEAGLLN